MKQEGFQVVAELYRFLATFDASAIVAASKLPGVSENLRTALLALHRETTAQRSRSGKTGKASNSSANKPNLGALDPVGLLMDKDRFPAKEDLLKLARSLRLKLKVDSKTSRERVARQIARIADDDAAVREKLYELVINSADDQTTGWFELIRRGQ